MGWNDVNGKGSGDKDHLQLTPNTARLVHVLVEDGEEPYSYWTHYIPSKNANRKGRVIRCPGRNECPACADGSFRTSRRHAINVYDYESKTVKILEKGNTLFEQLKMIKDQYGSFKNIDVSLKRSGEGKNTQYLAIPIPRVEPFDEALVAQGKYALEAHLPLHTPQQIENIIVDLSDTSPKVDDGFGFEAEAEGGYIGEPTGIQEFTVLEFGKYKGKTFEEIAEAGDLNYVKWAAENMSDPKLKAQAQKVVDRQKPNNTGAATPSSKASTPSSVPQQDYKKLLIDEIQGIINSDKCYASNISLVVEKMKQATATPTFPSGKTLLLDYTEPELIKLKGLLKG